MLSKHSADDGFGQFVTILEWVCWKTDAYFGKVDKNGTSQTCPNCGAHTGKKELKVRIHNCKSCGYTTTREQRIRAIVCFADWESFAFRAAAQEVRNRGLKAVGQVVSKNVCGDGLAGVSGHTSLAKNLGSRKLES